MYCRQLPFKCPDCEIIYGDGRDPELLADIGISEMDAFVALTDSSETNIFTCLTAKDMGIKKTPALSRFPNDGHTDWQWYPIVKASYPLILDRLNYMDYRPTVQVIDNIERNHRLGLVMEFNVDRGRLLLLMADMNALEKEPEGRQ